MLFMGSVLIGFAQCWFQVVPPAYSFVLSTFPQTLNFANLIPVIANSGSASNPAPPQR